MPPSAKSLGAAMLLVACAASPPARETASAPAPCPTVTERAPEPDAPPVGASTTPATTFDLPQAAEWNAVLMIFAVEISQSGELTVDGRVIVSDAELTELAKQALSKEPEVRAVIRADRRVEHGRVITVLDLIKRAGIAKIAFAVSPRAAP